MGLKAEGLSSNENSFSGIVYITNSFKVFMDFHV